MPLGTVYRRDLFELNLPSAFDERIARNVEPLVRESYTVIKDDVY